MKLLSDQSVADRIFKTTSTLAKWRCLGVGPPFVKVGPRGVAYPEEELESWLRANVRSSTAGGGHGGRRRPAAVSLDETR